MDTLWTLQSVRFWHELEKRKIIFADGRRVYRHYRRAYQWMMRQMKLKLPDYGGGYPIWAWQYPKPDLRRSEFRFYREHHSVLIELKLPEDRRLLSEFGAWHFVLNNWDLSLNKEEDEAWQKKLDAAKGNKELLAKYYWEIEETWQRIFDVALLKRHPDICGPDPEIQAVLEYIVIEDVVRMRFIPLIE